MRRKPDTETPLPLTAGDLDAARLALTPPVRGRLRVRWVLLCATLMTAAALALCAAVLGGGAPQAYPPSAGARGALAR